MRKYNHQLFFDNGECVAKVGTVAESAKEAVNKLNEFITNEQFLEDTKHMKLCQVLIDLEGVDYAKPDEKRFDFQPSTQKENYFVATDKKTLVCITFKKKEFNTTQDVKVISDITDAAIIAESARLIADYIQEYHPECM